MIAKINLLGEKRRGESRKRKQHKTEYNNNYKLFKILHRFKLQSSYRYGSDGEGKDVGNAGDGDCHAGVL